jgi:hypothetical protein
LIVDIYLYVPYEWIWTILKILEQDALLEYALCLQQR